MVFVSKGGAVRGRLNRGVALALVSAVLAGMSSPGLAQSPPPVQGQAGQPNPQSGAMNPGLGSTRVMGIPGTPSIAEMQKNKTEYLRTHLDSFRRDLNVRGAQADAFTAFDRVVMASVPTSVKYVRDFCEDPTPQEGRGNFGEAAKRIGTIRELLKGRQAVLQDLDTATAALHQSVAGNDEQAKVYDHEMPMLIKLITSVPFGLPDTGLPLNCSTVNGVPAGEAKFAPPPGVKLPEPGAMPR